MRAGRRNVTARLPRVGTWRFWLFEQAVLAICDVHYLALLLSRVPRPEARARALASVRRAMGEE